MQSEEPQRAFAELPRSLLLLCRREVDTLRISDCREYDELLPMLYQTDLKMIS